MICHVSSCGYPIWFSFSQCQRNCDGMHACRDPNNMVLAFANMMKNKVAMPAHFMDDLEHADVNGRGLFKDFAAVAQSTGTYTALVRCAACLQSCAWLCLLYYSVRFDHAPWMCCCSSKPCKPPSSCFFQPWPARLLLIGHTCWPDSTWVLRQIAAWHLVSNLYKNLPQEASYDVQLIGIHFYVLVSSATCIISLILQYKMPRNREEIMTEGRLKNIMSLYLIGRFSHLTWLVWCLLGMIWTFESKPCVSHLNLLLYFFYRSIYSTVVEKPPSIYFSKLIHSSWPS